MKKLRDDHHIVRYVKASLVNKTDDGIVIGIHPQAFELKPEERGLSTTWREYYLGDRLDQLKAVKKQTTLRMTPKAAFASLNVGATHEVCRMCGRKVRIVLDPRPGIPAHSSILQMPRDNDILLGLLANLASQDFEQVINL